MTSLINPEPPRTSPTDLAASAHGDDSECEIVDGKIVESAPMGVREVHIASTLMILLGSFVRIHRLGRVESEMLFILRAEPLLRRKPDVAFVSAQRSPIDRPLPDGEAAWNVIPDLVIEVVSPTDLSSEVHARIAEYRAVGVQRIWVVYPEQCEIYDYRTGQPVQVHGPGAAIDGGAILPGFVLALNDVFELS